jgi:bacterioferritin
MARTASNLENKDEVLRKLDEILEFELSGVTRYLHYSFMVFGPNRIPITKWMRDQATDGLDHAAQVGEWITALAGHPSVKVGATPEGHRHDIKTILEEALAFEDTGLKRYHQLLDLVRDKHVALEEWTRELICQEQDHIYEIEKMLLPRADM